MGGVGFVKREKNFVNILLNISGKTWKQTTCPLIGEWIKKVQYIYTVQYYSATKKKCHLQQHGATKDSHIK